MKDKILVKDKIITTKEIEEILEKYNIGKKPLSLVLGWGEVTIIRYLDGNVPDKLHSNVLFSIKNNPNLLLEYLEKNKKLITKLAYKKVKTRVEELEQKENKENIHLITKHIIAVLEDTTPLALQKILYYIDSFSLALLDRSIFEYSPEAWVHGPVYKNIYEEYSYYRFNSIDKTNFTKYLNIECLEEEIITLIDEVIKCFGCYSGKVLEKMTHLSNSWIDTRGTLKSDEASNRIIDKNKMQEEFKDICKKYQIKNYQDISKFSNKLFRKVIK